jgi:hypothetical protein
MEIWEMTFEEYRQSVKGKRLKKFGGFNREGVLRWNHEMALCSAVQAKKPIPQAVIDSVLNFYPSGQLSRVLAIEEPAVEENDTLTYPEPSEAFEAVNAAAFDEEGLPVGRDAASERLAHIMAAQGWRFTSDYRHEVSPAHSLIYRLISTVEANRLADDLVTA